MIQMVNKLGNRRKMIGKIFYIIPTILRSGGIKLLWQGRNSVPRGTRHGLFETFPRRLKGAS